MAKYIIHKAVEITKVKQSARPSSKVLETYLWQPKIDGCNTVVLHTPESTKLLSRTAEDVVSAPYLAEAFSLMPHGVYFGEFTIPCKDFPDISGAFRKKLEEVPGAVLYLFDHITLRSWEEGHSRLPYATRINTLAPIPNSVSHLLMRVPTGTREATEQWMKANSQLRYDGIIARKPSGTWTKGSSGVTGEILKFKTVLSYDLSVVGIEEGVGEKTGRPVYKVVCSYLGKSITVGSGVPHLHSDLPKPGDIVEIECMGHTPAGLLREPRYKGLRPDKLQPDA